MAANSISQIKVVFCNFKNRFQWIQPLAWNCRDKWLTSKNGCLSTKNHMGMRPYDLCQVETSPPPRTLVCGLWFFYHFCKQMHFLGLIEMEAVLSINSNGSSLSSAVRQALCGVLYQVPGLTRSHFEVLCDNTVHPLCFDMISSFTKTLSQLPCDSSLSGIISEGVH